MKKRLFFLIIALLALIPAHAYYLSAVAPSGQTLYYIITGTNTVMVTSPNSSYPYYSTYPTGALTIPSTITYNSHTYSVTSVGECAFAYCSSLTSVIIPNSVTSIGYDAFAYCSSLTTVTIPNSVTTIGNDAFYGCSSLSSVTFNAVNCTSMGDNFNPVFSGCSNLTSLTIGDSVQTIPNYAFSYCSSLTSITIPNSVTTIGSYAFYLVKNIVYSGTATGSPWGALCVNGYIEGDLIYTNSSKTNLVGCATTASNVTIPNSVTTISSYAFSHCSYLTSVTIPTSVTSIGNSAFSSCTSLTSVTFNAVNCTSMGNYNYPVFSGCSNLTSLTIGDSVQTIPNYAFYDCSALTSVTIPNSVTSIGEGAFYNCGLRGILNINPRMIGSNAFANQTQLTNIMLGNVVDSVKSSAFSGCTNVTNLTLGSGLRYIGDNAFSGLERLTGMTCKASNAPYVSNINAFTDIPTNIPVTIPCNSLNNYQYAYGWHLFSNLQSTMTYSLNVTAADPTHGGITIITQPTCENAQAQFQANPYNGYRFDHWSDGNTDNPRYLVVTSDTTLYAFFESQDGISDTDKPTVTIRTLNTQIIIEGVQNEPVRLFDAVGRLLSTSNTPEETRIFSLPAAGVYLIQIGNSPAQRVVVAK